MNNTTWIKSMGLVLGPVAFSCFLWTEFPQISENANLVIGMACWMIIWWISEAVSISVTALLPITLFPLLGIMDIKSVSAFYASPIVYLFFGGFVMALALEKVNLHKRIAINILKLTGTHADGIVFGFMLSTALMSMWISNTASTVVMLPIAISVINLLLTDPSKMSKGQRAFCLTIMLGIAFGANIGGMATLIGTPPNSVMLAFMENQYQIEIDFLRWMLMGVPFSMILLLTTFYILVRVFYPNGMGKVEEAQSIIEAELKQLGSMGRGEKIVSVIFILAALMWILRSQINVLIPQAHLTDTNISLMAALLLFITPIDWREHKFALAWKDTEKLPWGILILFGGGLALAAGLSEVGLIDFIGDYLSSQKNWPVIAITSILIFLMLFMTELIGNVALVTILVPLVAGISQGIGVSMLELVIPVTLASSCAFMLPMATPPNAIVFASGHIKVFEMARVGFFLNLISVVFLIALSRWIIPFIFQV
ncbi:MAG: DASS family sodium-coupled anion symporter [Bacteroidia bacterium]|nr:DASS family sodium-coupled anion symporter [Bacteroidia bacterium]